MNILHTPVRFYPYTGGVENHVYDLSKKLVERGHDVRVVCAATGEEPRGSLDGIQINRLFSVGKIAQTNITPALPIRLLNICDQVDIIHTHLPTPWSADVSAAIGEMSDTPVVLTYHNDIVGDGIADTIASVYNRTVLKFTLNATEQIIITQRNYLDSSPYLSEFSEKVSVIHNGVDTQKFRPSAVCEDERSRLGFRENRFNLFFLSVLDEYHEYKGLNLLLRAMKQLRDEMDPPPHLVVGGDGALRDRYERFAEELGVDDAVTFKGFVPESDLPKSYTSADAFVLPSTSSDQEGFGLVLLEALSCGTPVVSTEVVGVSDEISSEGLGRIVEPKSVSKLVDGIVEVQGIHDAEDIVSRCRELCTNRYSWDSMAERTEKLYQEVLERQ